jgi:hypothetical protein
MCAGFPAGGSRVDACDGAEAPVRTTDVRGGHVSILWIIVIVLLLLLLFGGYGYSRR